MPTVTEKALVSQTINTNTTTQVDFTSTTTSCFENTVTPKENSAKSEQVKNLEEKIARKERELEFCLEKIADEDFNFRDKHMMMRDKSKLYNIASTGGSYATVLGTSAFLFGALIAGSGTVMAVGAISLLAGLAVMGTCSLIAALKDDEQVKDYYEKSINPLIQEINDLKQELANLTDKQKINTTI